MNYNHNKMGSTNKSRIHNSVLLNICFGSMPVVTAKHFTDSQLIIEIKQSLGKKSKS